MDLKKVLSEVVSIFDHGVLIFDKSRDGLGEICPLFIIEGLDSINIHGFDKEFDEIRSFWAFQEKHRFVSVEIRSLVTIEEQDSSINGGIHLSWAIGEPDFGILARSEDNFGDGRSYNLTLHLRSYRSLSLDL